MLNKKFAKYIQGKKMIKKLSNKIIKSFTSLLMWHNNEKGENKKNLDKRQSLNLKKDNEDKTNNMLSLPKENDQMVMKKKAVKKVAAKKPVAKKKVAAKKTVAMKVTGIAKAKSAVKKVAKKITSKPKVMGKIKMAKKAAPKKTAKKSMSSSKAGAKKK